jgi:hypothetical protein
VEVGYLGRSLGPKLASSPPGNGNASCHYRVFGNASCGFGGQSRQRRHASHLEERFGPLRGGAIESGAKVCEEPHGGRSSVQGLGIEHAASGDNRSTAYFAEHEAVAHGGGDAAGDTQDGGSAILENAIRDDPQPSRPCPAAQMEVVGTPILERHRQIPNGP